MTVTTQPTAHDVRHAERVCRGRAADLDRMADDLERNAPPVALDPAANAHAMRLAALRRHEASLNRECAVVHAEYATELEGRAAAAQAVTWTAGAESTWNSAFCTCGQGDRRGHYLSCAKWIAVREGRPS